MWFHSSTQVVFETWRAADCRPYRRSTIHPHRLYSKRGGRQVAAPTGVVPFIHTGCIRNVAGGRLPPLHTQPLCAYCSYNVKRRTAPHPPPMAVPLPRRGRSCVVPFIHTGCIRNVAGGRLPPLQAQPLCAYCSYNVKRRTAPHPPPMAVPLPRRGRSCVVPFIHTG